MIQDTDRILVPVDFSPQSVVAFEQSFNLARDHNAEIILFHVIEDAGSLSKYISVEQYEDLKKSVQKQLDDMIAGVSGKGNVKITTQVASGAVYEKINEVAKTVKATFVVMGTNGDEGAKKRFIGANTLRVIRELPVPLITMKTKPQRGGFKNIVLPLDLSKETREKVTKAIELSKLFKSAIRVVFVLFTTDEFIVNRLTRQLGQVKAYFEKEGVECTAEIVKGIKGEETLAQNILEYSVKVEGDLIMVMTQQEVEFTPFFIGSSAQEIINNSKIPVLSIRPLPKKNSTVFSSPY